MNRRLLTAAGLLLVAIALYFATRPQPSSPRPEVRQQPVPMKDAVPAESGPASAPDEIRSGAPIEAAPANVSAGNAASRGAAGIERTLAGPDAAAKPGQPQADVDPIQDLEQVQLAVRGFRDVLGQNPVGTNAEITKTLLGDNIKQIKMTMPPGSALNEDGELVDRWGTPYFFHQISGTEMEIRSAGPDRKMWTRDDRQVK